MSNCLLEDAIASYKMYAEAECRSRKTIDDNIRNVREFCLFLNRDDITTITVEDLQRYLVYLRSKIVWSGTSYAKERPLSKNSINAYFRSIRGFWNYLEYDKKFTVNPLATVTAPELSKPLPMFLMFM
ncbi:MAG: phage integrase SAM-like domain-containing protein [Dehalococcoidales bacterium]|nr:phage integrase SAM-like domain-containing protein [Dehalococcoidales bacterium]